MKIILIVSGALAGLALLGWLGLKIMPAPFPAFPQGSQPMKTIPLPAGLPAPVERFYRQVYGDQAPVIESAVITGRGRLRPFGPFYLPARFRFTHIAGQSYRHYIEATFFGLPLFKVNERYVDGKSLFEAPVGVIDDDPKQNQGANLGMWSETLWMPAIFLTDPRVRWEPVNESTALLVVPFEDTEETYVVRFDPDSGWITYLESMRYQSPQSREKTLWLNETVAWGELAGVPMVRTGAAIWLDQRTPWAFFTIEDIVFNVDVQEYIRAKGP
jgi:hypothetical protein